MSPRARVSFRLYLITDRHVVKGGDLVSACEAALSAAPPGAVALQLREKDLPARELYELALCLREICTRAGAPLIVNDRVNVAIAANADGVHLPFDSIGVSMARKLLGPDRLVGVSSHSPPDVAGAAREGADFAVFGPVFDPLSKPGRRARVGCERPQGGVRRRRDSGLRTRRHHTRSRARTAGIDTASWSCIDRRDIRRGLARDCYCGDAVGDTVTDFAASRRVSGRGNSR